MPINLLANSKITRHSNAVAAGVTTITPVTAIDMAGYDSCTFLVAFGVIDASAVTSIEVHCSSDDGAVDTYTAVLGTNVVVSATDDNKIASIDVVRPPERYLKCIVNRATADSTVDAIIAIQTGAKALPVTADTTTVGNEVHQSPAEGAA